MTNIVSTPRQNAYKTNLSTSITAAALTASFDEMPSFSLSAGEYVYAVIDPKNSFREVVKLVGPYTAGASSITITRAEADYEGASSTAYQHSGGAVVVITNSWNIFDDITTAVNSKLDADGDGLEDSFDMQTASSGVRLRDDAGELKLTDSLNPEVSLSTLAAAAGSDTKTAVTVADTTPAVLDSKLTVSGTNITKSIVNPGANETLNLDVTVDSTPVDVEYTAEEDIAAGHLASKTSVADEVENTIISALGTAGTESTFTSNIVWENASCYVSDHKVAVIYDDDTDNKTYLVIGTVEVAGKTTSWGTPVEVDGNRPSNVAIKYMEDDKIAMAYCDTSNLYVRVATVSGTVPTLGTVSASVVTANVDYFDLCVVDTDKLIVAYADTADSSKGKARAADVTGTTVGAWDTAVEFEAGGTDYISISKFNTDYAGVFYADAGDTNKGKGALLVATGTSLAANTPVEFEANVAQYIDSAQLETDKVIVAYRDDNSGRVNSRVASLAGLTISYGVEVDVNVNGSAYVSVDNISGTEAYVAYEETSGSDGKFNKLSVSGTTITVGDENTFNSSTDNVAHVSLAKVSDKSKFIICYEDEADTQKGNAEVFQDYDNSDSIVGFNTATVTAGNTAVVRSKGVIDNQTGLTAGLPYYLSSTGTISSTVGDWRLGVAKDTDELDVQLEYLPKELVNGSDANDLHVHPGLISSDTSDTVISGTSETTLFTDTVPGGTLGTDGVVRVRLHISDFDLTNVQTCTFKLKYGATTVITHGITGAFTASNLRGFLEFTLMGAGATNSQEGYLSGHMGSLHSSMNNGGTWTNPTDEGTSAEDSTGDLTLAVTAQFNGGAIIGLTVSGAYAHIIK